MTAAHKSGLLYPGIQNGGLELKRLLSYSLHAPRVYNLVEQTDGPQTNNFGEGCMRACVIREGVS